MSDSIWRNKFTNPILLCAASLAFSNFAIAQVENVTGKILGVATWVDGIEGRRYNSDSEIVTVMKAEYRNSGIEPAYGEALRFTAISKHHTAGSSRYSQILLPGKSRVWTLPNSYVPRLNDWTLELVAIAVAPKGQSAFDMKHVNVGKNGKIKVIHTCVIDPKLTLHCRGFLFVHADWKMPGVTEVADSKGGNEKDVDSDFSTLIPAARSTFASVAMNNIGFAPWKEELDLSDEQFARITKRSTQWNIERGLPILQGLTVPDADEESLWRAFNAEQIEIAKKVLIPYQLDRLVQLHNQATFQGDTKLKKLAHWLANPMFNQFMELSQKQSEKNEDFAKELTSDLRELKESRASNLKSKSKRVERKLASVLTDSQVETVEALIGKEFMSDKWNRSLEIAREERQLEKQIGLLSGSPYNSISRNLYVKEPYVRIDNQSLESRSGYTYLVENPLIAEEIDLTKDQKKKLEEIDIKRKKVWSDDNAKTPKPGPEFEAARKQREAKLAALRIAKQNVYLPHQYDRARQILRRLSLKVGGYHSPLAHPDWPKVLKLNASQQKHFDETLKKADADLAEREKKATEKRNRRISESQDQLMELLDKSQTERFEDLFGKPVFLEWVESE